MHAFATHALLTPGAVEVLGRSSLAEIAVTDTVMREFGSLSDKW